MTFTILPEEVAEEQFVVEGWMGKAARKLIFVNECIKCFESQLFATKVKYQQKNNI